MLVLEDKKGKKNPGSFWSSRVEVSRNPCGLLVFGGGFLGGHRLCAVDTEIALRGPYHADIPTVAWQVVQFTGRVFTITLRFSRSLHNSPRRFLIGTRVLFKCQGPARTQSPALLLSRCSALNRSAFSLQAFTLTAIAAAK